MRRLDGTSSSHSSHAATGNEESQAPWSRSTTRGRGSTESRTTSAMGATTEGFPLANLGPRRVDPDATSATRVSIAQFTGAQPLPEERSNVASTSRSVMGGSSSRTTSAQESRRYRNDMQLQLILRELSNPNIDLASISRRAAAPRINRYFKYSNGGDVSLTAEGTRHYSSTLSDDNWNRLQYSLSERRNASQHARSRSSVSASVTGHLTAVQQQFPARARAAGSNAGGSGLETPSSARARSIVGTGGASRANEAAMARGRQLFDLNQDASPQSSASAGLVHRTGGVSIASESALARGRRLFDLNQDPDSSASSGSIHDTGRLP